MAPQGESPWKKLLHNPDARYEGYLFKGFVQRKCPKLLVPFQLNQQFVANDTKIHLAPQQEFQDFILK